MFAAWATTEWPAFTLGDEFVDKLNTVMLLFWQKLVRAPLGQEEESAKVGHTGD